MKINYLLLLLLLAGISPVAAQNFAGRTVVGEEVARQEIRKVVRDSSSEHFSKPVLPTKAVAIAVAEPIVFQVYGRKEILAERPYEAYLINGFWYIAGTLPEGYRGGTFEIILAASDGRVLYLTHGK